MGAGELGLYDPCPPSVHEDQTLGFVFSNVRVPIRIVPETTKWKTGSVTTSFPWCVNCVFEMQVSP